MDSSCIYDCKVWHSRFSPKEYAFNFATFMVLLDLDELKQPEHLKQTIGPVLSLFYSFNKRDHIDATDKDILEKVLDYVKESSSLLHDRITKVRLLTNLKFAGFVFSPISVFYCFDASDSLVASVIEVENTFRERKLYLIDLSKGDANEVHEKEFYVSPFSSVDGRFHFHVTAPEEILDLEVTSFDQSTKLLQAGLRGKRIKLDATNLWKMTLCHPYSCLLVWLAIHMHAGILYLKGVPHYAKQEKPEVQKPYYSRQVQR